MFTMFLRQRRRLVLFALMAALPLAALIFLSVVAHWGFATALASGAVAGAMLMAIPLLILRFAQRYRSICEGMILGVCVGIALQVVTLPLAELPMIGPFQALIGLCLLVLFFAADLPNRLMPKRTYTGRRRYRTRQSAYTLWADHVPDPGLLDRHWTDELHRLEMDRHDPAIRIATYRLPEGEMRQRQHMTEETTHASFAYDFTQLLDDGRSGPTGAYGMIIADHGTYRDVTINQRVDHLPFMAWLGAWLDDIVGDECDHHVARAEGRADYTITGARIAQAPHRPVGPIAPKNHLRAGQKAVTGNEFLAHHP